MKLRLSHKTCAIAAIPLIFGICFYSYLSIVLKETHDAAVAEAQARRALDSESELTNSIIELASCVYAYSRQVSDENLNKYEKTKRHMQELRRRIEQHPQGDAAGKAIVEKSSKEMDELLALADEIIEAMPKKKDPLVQLRLARCSSDLVPAVSHVRDDFDGYRKVTTEKVQEAERELNVRNAQLRNVLLLGFATAFGISLLMATLLNKSIIGRLQSLNSYANALSRDETSETPDPTGDEIGDLIRSFSLMSKQLEETTRRERAVVDNAADVIFSINDEGAFVAGSTAAKGLDLKTHLEEIRTKPEFTLEQIVTKDGATRTIRISGRWSEDRTSASCVAHDITAMAERQAELQRVEEKIRLMLERMPAAFIVLKDDGEIERSNALAEDYLEFEADIAALLPEPGRVSLREIGGRWLEVTTAQFAERGETKQLAVLLDVNERVKVKQMQDRLVAMLAHDIGTPLSSIQTILKLVSAGKYGTVKETNLQLATEAEAKSRELMRLFKDLLSLERTLQQ